MEEWTFLDEATLVLSRVNDLRKQALTDNEVAKKLKDLGLG